MHIRVYVCMVGYAKLRPCIPIYENMDGYVQIFNT